MFKMLNKVEYDSLKVLLKHNEALINNDPFALAELSHSKMPKTVSKNTIDKGKKLTTII